jgi:radical SAM protein with 4Fe4S-binding SPASM domain
MPHCDKRAITFVLTTKCNLACKYCYTSRSIGKQVLDIDFAKKAIEEYVGRNSKWGLDHIRFYAEGEATTEFDLLKEIYYTCRERCPDMIAELQTNGVFSEEKAEWLGENMDLIWISFDLLPEPHDMFRVIPNGNPSSPMVIKTLEYFRDHPKKATVGVRGTITDHNLYRQKEGIDFLIPFGIDRIWVDPIFPPVEDEEERVYDPIDTMEFARQFIPARKYAKERGVFYESNYTSSFDGECIINCRSCIPLPHLTTDGYVSACEMALFGKDPKHMDPMIYGKYDKSTDTIQYYDDKIKDLQKRVLWEMPADCQICVARNHCAGFCPGETLNETKSLFMIKDCVCKPIRYLYSRIGNDYSGYENDYKYRHP